MIVRRTLISWLAAILLGGITSPDLRAAAAADDPLAVINAIYVRVTKGKGDGGGGFVIDPPSARPRYLSRSLVDLWARADARTQKGDEGPVGFDPTTNSQDPDVTSFKAVAETREADRAVIAVTLAGRRAPRPVPADRVVRYDFVRQAGQWKIDDIRGAVDGKKWSLRAILQDSFKY